jgi:hypothetical protein
MCFENLIVIGKTQGQLAMAEVGCERRSFAKVEQAGGKDGLRKKLKIILTIKTYS